MRKAFKMIRVSTDEQANKGYSQRYQDEVLDRYCQINNIIIVATYYEDYSGKTFNRPEFNKMLITLKKHRGIADLLLFTKWDRFSRNTAESYGMISTLKKIGVEVQAIEQPLNMKIPESKLMLALYLAHPEVENDRRGLNVKHGMRRAKKEGRWMGAAPVGYCNKINELGRKYIAPDAEYGPIMQRLFERIAENQFSVKSLINQAQEEGLKVITNTIYVTLRNPVYCGMIRLNADEEEVAEVVEGQHDGIVSKELFFKVQEILEGKANYHIVKTAGSERFPLRGHLVCNKCGRVLTASASKGNTKYYSYYHCTAGCPVRYKSNIVEQKIAEELASLQPHPGVMALYQEILQEELGKGEQARRLQMKQAKDQLQALAAKQQKALELLMAETIGGDDYQAIKTDCLSKTVLLEGKLHDLTQHPKHIDQEVKAAMELLANLDQYYLRADTHGRRALLSSIYPEKVVFDGTGFRTLRTNEVIALLFNLDKALEQKNAPVKTGAAETSCKVVPTSEFSNLFFADLKRLSNTYELLKAA